MFKLVSPNKPGGDQPKAIKSLSDGIKRGLKHQVLLGVTGSGKTFTVANVIEQVQKSTLVIAHNKTLAAQLCNELRELFPENEVHYFVSYYDYYQPEAYMPGTDTYISKEAHTNDEIDRLRHAATTALLTKKDVIIVASVSAIYGLGSPDLYKEHILHFRVGDKISREELARKLQAQFNAEAEIEALKKESITLSDEEYAQRLQVRTTPPLSTCQSCCWPQGAVVVITSSSSSSSCSDTPLSTSWYLPLPLFFCRAST